MINFIQKITNYFKSLSIVSKISLVSVLSLGILGLLLQNIFPDRIPQVTSISPVYTIGVPENSDITISFSTVLDESTKNNIRFSIDPEISANGFWLENGYQYYFQNTKPFKNNTNYTISVFYKKNNIFSHSFMTNEFSLEEQQAHIREQAQEDINFDEAIKKLQAEYPWYDDIPLETEQFTIIYNYDRKQFRIRLQVSEDTNQEIIDNLTNKALTALMDKNIDVDDWGGYYVVFIQ